MRRGKVASGVSCLATACVLLAAPLSHAAPLISAGRPLPPCGPPSAATWLTRGDARVYSRKVSGEFGQKEKETVACLPGSRPVHLDPPRKEDGTVPWLYPEWMVLRPPWMAYVKNFVEVDIGELEIAVVNLRNGRFRHCYVADWSGSGWRYGIRGLVLTETGSAGFMGVREEGYVGEVLACAGNSLRRLDEGPDIDLRSLRLRGSVMHWSNAGRERSHRLP